MKGVYKILNKVTQDFYIGSTTISFSRRFTQHKSDLRKNKHRNIHLQRAYNKYGLDNFEFIIVETIEDDSIILEREQFYLDLKPKYNLATIAGNSAKGRKLNPEQIEKVRQRFIGKPSWNKGLKFSEESRKRMSEAKKGKTSPKKGITGISDNPIIRSDGQIYKNPQEAAEILGVKANTIIKSISDKKIIRKVKGFTFKYLDKLE